MEANKVHLIKDRQVQAVSGTFNNVPRSFTILFWPNLDQLTNWVHEEIYQHNDSNEDKLINITTNIAVLSEDYDNKTDNMLNFFDEKLQPARTSLNIKIEDYLKKFQCQKSIVYSDDTTLFCYNANDPIDEAEMDANGQPVLIYPLKSCNDLEQDLSNIPELQQFPNATQDDLGDCQKVGDELAQLELLFQQMDDERTVLIGKIEEIIGLKNNVKGNWINTEFNGSAFDLNDKNPFINLKVKFNSLGDYSIYSNLGEKPEIEEVRIFEEDGASKVEFKIYEKASSGERIGTYYHVEMNRAVVKIGLRYMGDIKKYTSSGILIQEGVIKLIFPIKK